MPHLNQEEYSQDDLLLASRVRSIIRLMAKEFSETILTDDELDSWILRYRNQVSSSLFNLDYDLALAYYTAHNLTLLQIGDDLAGSKYIVESEREGDVARSYVKGRDTYEKTIYGTRLKDLYRSKGGSTNQSNLYSVY